MRTRSSFDLNTYNYGTDTGDAEEVFVCGRHIGYFISYECDVMHEIGW